MATATTLPGFVTGAIRQVALAQVTPVSAVPRGVGIAHARAAQVGQWRGTSNSGGRRTPGFGQSIAWQLEVQRSARRPLPRSVRRDGDGRREQETEQDGEDCVFHGHSRFRGKFTSVSTLPILGGSCSRAFAPM